MYFNIFLEVIMALVVNTNIGSLDTQRFLSSATAGLAKDTQRLSSGLRINSAADDAAGLQISSRLTSQVNGLNQGSRNANDGISVAQTAEGALDEYTNIVQRMRTLAVQSSNGSNSDADRTALDEEFTQLETELDRLADQTTFGGVNLLDATYSAAFQIGADAGQTISISITQNFSSATIGAAGSLTGFAEAQTAITDLDSVLATVNSTRAELGARQNRFSSVVRSNDISAENLEASRSRIEDTDYAATSASLAKNSVLQQASSTMLAQANQQPQIALSLL
jgi:flagellin